MTADVARYAGFEPDAAGVRIGELLDELARNLPQDAFTRVVELARLLTTVHGAALARIVDVAGGLPEGDEVMAALIDDPLVASVLVVHDLHPGGTPPPAGPPAAAGGQPVRLLPRRRGPS